MQDINLRITVDSSGAVSSVNNVGMALEKFTSRAQRADGKLREFEKGLGSFRRAILGVQSAILGFGLMDLVRDLVRVNAEFERVRFSLLAGHDSMAAANADFAWLRKEAIKLGMPLNKVGLEFAKLAAASKQTALQGQPVRDIFSSVGKASIAMGLDVSTTQRVFMALTQMLSKGRVQAEEARQQFGEHLPGGFKALAVAAGFDAVTSLGKFQDALKKGQVDAVAMLTKLPKVLDEMFGPAFEAALVSSPMVAINQFKALMANVAYTVGQSGGFMQEFVGMIRDMSDAVTTESGQREIERLANSLGFLMGVVRQAAKFIVTHIHEVTAAFTGLTAASIIVGLRGLVGWMGKLAGASSLSAALTNPWILLAVAVGAAVTALLMFSDNMLNIEGTNARVVDWLVSGLQIIGGELNKIGQRIMAMLAGPIATLMPFLNAVGVAFFNTFTALAQSLKATFDQVKASLEPTIKWIEGALGGIDFATFAKKTLVVIANVLLGLVNMIGPTVQLIVDLLRIGMEAIAPIITPIANFIVTLFDIMVDAMRRMMGLTPDTSAWDVLKGAISATWDVVSVVVGAVVGLVAFIANIAGPIIDVISNVVRGLYDAVAGVITAVVGLFTDANKDMSNTSGKTTKKTGIDWIHVADIIVGSILTVIRIMGMMARALLSFGALAIEVGGRVGEVFLALGQAILGVMTWDMDKIKDAGKEMAQAFTRPLRTDGAAAIDALASDARAISSGADFHTVSDAVGTGSQAAAATEAFDARVAPGFSQIGAMSFVTGQPALNVAAEKAGRGAGNAYLNGLMAEWQFSASSRTIDAAAKRAALKAAQDDLAAKQGAAWAAENAGVDRSVRPEQTTSGAARSHHAKTPAQKAQDQINDLLASQATDNALSIQIALHPYLDDNAIKAVESAQDALRKAGYEFSYAEAQAQGGMPKLLADTAYSASLANQQLQEYKKMQEEIGKNMQAIDAMQEQVNLSRDLTISSNELSDTLAAQQQLRSSGSRMTVQEATSLDALGKAIHPVEYALVQSTKAQAGWNREAKAAAEIAKDLRGFQQTRDDMLALASAQATGETAMIKATATIAAQHAVMDKFGDDVFDSSRLLDANTQALYDNAYAMSILGGNANSAAAAIKNINDAYLQMTDPAAAAQQKALDSAAGQRSILDGYLAQAGQKRDAAVSDALGGDPSQIDATIQRAIADYNQAKAIYNQAVGQLNALTTEEIRANSNDFSDAAHTAWTKFAKDAQAIGGQIQATFTKAFDGMTDALTQFVMTGKMDFASLALSVIQDITRMIIKWLIWMAIKTAANFMGIPFADGGVMTDSGSAPLKTYSTGGIANSPQMAVFGEGSKPEAYVPLPDGRTIPVTMTMPQPTGGSMGNPAAVGYAIADALMSSYKPSTPSTGYTQPTGGGSSGKIEINAPITVKMEGGGQSGQGGGMDQKTLDMMSKKISGELRSVVVSVVQDEMRPGGTFNKMGSNRSRF